MPAGAAQVRDRRLWRAPGLCGGHAPGLRQRAHVQQGRHRRLRHGHHAGGALPACRLIAEVRGSWSGLRWRARLRVTSRTSPLHAAPLAGISNPGIRSPTTYDRMQCNRERCFHVISIDGPTSHCSERGNRRSQLRAQNEFEDIWCNYTNIASDHVLVHHGDDRALVSS